MGVLTTADKEKIKRVIPKTANKIIDATVARLYIADPNPDEWTYTGLVGAIVLVDDLVGHTFWLKLVDILGGRGVVWDQELYVNFEYNQDRTFFHSFELEKFYAGLLFEDTSDATHFYKRVTGRAKHGSKKTVNNKQAIALKEQIVDSPKIPGPRGDSMINSSDLASNPQRARRTRGPLFYDDQPPLEWRSLYKELEAAGITEDMIADNRDFIKDYIKQQGGPLVGLEPPIPRKYAHHASPSASASATATASASQSQSQSQSPLRTLSSRLGKKAPPPPPPTTGSSSPSSNSRNNLSSAAHSINEDYENDSDANDDSSSNAFDSRERSVPPPVPGKDDRFNSSDNNKNSTPSTTPHPVHSAPPPMAFIGTHVQQDQRFVPSRQQQNRPTPSLPPAPPARNSVPPPLPPSRNQYAPPQQQFGNRGPPPPPPPRRGGAPPPPPSRNTGTPQMARTVPQLPQRMVPNPPPAFPQQQQPQQLQPQQPQQPLQQQQQPFSYMPSPTAPITPAAPRAAMPPPTAPSAPAAPPPPPLPPTNYNSVSTPAAPAPPPPPMPDMGSANGSSSPAPMPAMTGDSNRDALLNSIQQAGIGSLRKVDKSQLDKPSVILQEGKGESVSLNNNTNGGGGTTGSPAQQGNLADAISAALAKRKNKVSNSDAEDNDDW
ncbi:hypothetical protein PACTADRAFT_49151 [Pachysolen tannophilus NRRL Y-2460]|uniref:WH1 domain-containing protein n=1 Tax=Pachysolen tannophilus NRRL Y-2460 TaxID=669874 RepID=A0A1E4U0B7_PACTA|nr:hypothetical protein PACTADRAFT_49151 [Pachysolen tannophilus NRRL Y-2460]